MSRIPLFLLALALLPGCTAFKPTTPASKELAATLLFVQGDKPLDVGSGIVSVDNYYFPSAPVKLAYISPGGREIGYNCPGYIYVDGPPTVVQTFEGGKRYELFCRGGKPGVLVTYGQFQTNPERSCWYSSKARTFAQCTLAGRTPRQ